MILHLEAGQDRIKENQRAIYLGQRLLRWEVINCTRTHTHNQLLYLDH